MTCAGLLYTNVFAYAEAVPFLTAVAAISRLDKLRD